MRLATINFLLDAVLLVIFCGVLALAAIVELVFPDGTAAGGWMLWGRSYDQWAFLLSCSLTAFAIGVLLHVILHWSWVCNFVAQRIRQYSGRTIEHNAAIDTIYGVGLMVVVMAMLGGILLAAEFSIEAP